MRLSNDRLAAIACVVVGLLMATLPHLIAWSESGDPAWVSDNDDRFYLGVAAQSYLNHPWKLADPVRAEGGPSLYRPLPLLPGVWAARGLGLGPLAIGLAWRAGAGVTMALAWYALIRSFFARPWVAAAVAMVLLADGGLIEGRPVVRQASMALGPAIRGEGPLYVGKPMAHPEWRVSTPAVTMAYLVAWLWALGRARERPTRGRIALAGLALGLLFYVYFYYWTAAGLALLIGLAIDSGHRRVHLLTGVIGSLVGLPALVSDVLLKRGTPVDWLHRTDKFLAIGRFDELLLPKLAIVGVVLAIFWIMARRRDLIPIWTLAASGLILANHQVVTALQIENFHWCYAWGPAVSLLAILIVARPIAATRRGPVALGVVASLVVGSGLWLRGLESTHSHDSVANARDLARYRAARPPAGLSPNAVVAGDPGFVDFAAILDNARPLSNYWVTLSPTVTDPEWDDRIALNAILLGDDRPAFEANQRTRLGLDAWGPWHRDPIARADRIRSRLDAYDRDLARIDDALDRYHVRYVALPDGAHPAYLGDRWTRIATGKGWDVWERKRRG